MKEVKRILRYFKETLNLVLWYLASASIEQVGFADVDYARYLVDRKSTS